MKLFASLTFAAALFSLAAPAIAQFQKPEDAVKYRKAAMTLMAAHVGRIGAMTAEKVPFDARSAAENAAVVEALSKLPWAAFGPGTDKGETRAKPEIWSEGARFKKTTEELMVSTSQLSVAAKTGNLAALKQAFGETAKTCKACHDSFRKE